MIIGRSPRCELVLREETASRTQALVYLGADGPQLVILGKGVTTVNGSPVEHERALAAGDVIGLPGLALSVEAEAAAGVPGDEPRTGWLVESSSGNLFGVSVSPFVIGGGAAVDVRFDGWPDEVMRLHSAEQRLHLEAIEPLELDGVALAAGEIERVDVGSVIGYSGDRLTVLSGGQVSSGRTAAEDAAAQLPSRVRLEFLPRGGRLTVSANGREHSLYLADRRCDLIAALLSPPAPYQPGELIPDDTLIPRVWAHKASTRVNLNVLLHRVRRDLVRAGLGGVDLLQRASGGGATRFALADDAAVIIE